LNGAWLHLALNHIPVVAMPFGFLLVAAGLTRNSGELVQAGFAALVVAACITIPAFKSGGAAARIVRRYPGIERNRIHDHAEAGEGGFWAAEALGLAAVVGLFLMARTGRTPKGWTTVVLLGALGVSAWLAYVAHLGGLIRHPEIASAIQPPDLPAKGPDAR
jgi:hypothetical protein